MNEQRTCQLSYVQETIELSNHTSRSLVKRWIPGSFPGSFATCWSVCVDRSPVQSYINNWEEKSWSVTREGHYFVVSFFPTRKRSLCWLHRTARLRPRRATLHRSMPFLRTYTHVGADAICAHYSKRHVLRAYVCLN